VLDDIRNADADAGVDADKLPGFLGDRVVGQRTGPRGVARDDLLDAVEEDLALAGSAAHQAVEHACGHEAAVFGLAPDAGQRGH